jgi:hypothetical protein
VTERRIHLAKGRTLPLDLVSQTIAILGIRNSGKTNTAVVLVEEALPHVQTVVIDPLDVWYGLKSSADGKREGFPVTVLGGPHGDLPLLDTDGKVIADAIAERPASVILSLRHLSKAGQRRFVRDFAERLYHRKGEPGRDTPLFVVIDEADAFVPQRIPHGFEDLVGAIDDLVRRGRASGFGVTLISQRAAVVNKDVLTQIEMLVAHRHTSPQDRKALDAWVEEHGDQDKRATFLRELGGLPQGTAYLWSPGWLEVFERVQIRMRKTFDSSATPKLGARRVEPTRLAAGDLDAFREQLAASIAAAERNDPAKLRAEIARLQKAAAEIRPSAVAERVEVPVYTPEERDAIARLAAEVEARGSDVREVVEVINDASARLADVRARLADMVAAVDRLADKATRVPINGRGRPIDPLTERPLAKGVALRTREAMPGLDRVRAAVPVERASRGEQGILDALLYLANVGASPASRQRVAFVARQAATSSAYERKLSALARANLIRYPQPGMLELTEAGAMRANAPAEAPTTEALQQAIYGRLDAGSRDILATLVNVYPEGLSRERLALKVGQAHTSSAYERKLSGLRNLGLLDYPERGTVAATGALFLPGDR